MTRAGFVSIIGRPNAGKSTLLNALVDEKIALVSHKINATRKRLNIIVMHEDSQIIFVDTPGLHKNEKMLNQFMRQESLKALESCDLAVFLAAANDSVRAYEEFLEICGGKAHIVLLNKIDLLKNAEILANLAKYEPYKESYAALLPISSVKKINLDSLLSQIAKLLPESPYLYDPELITTQNLREIYREKIREAIFSHTNKEIPYQSDVEIKGFVEGARLDEIYANIIVEKESQKVIVVGSGGKSIKNIGITARKSIESFSGKKTFLRLEVVVKKGWSKDKNALKQLGYEA